MLNIVICEDNPAHGKYTEKLISSRLSDFLHNIDTFNSAEELLNTMQFGDYLPDIAVLDIDMGKMNGIELAKRLNAVAPECRIIFLTGHIDYALDVYETEHSYFVLKDKAEEHIGQALDKALSRINSPKTRQKSITLHTGSETHVIPINHIEYFERYNRRTKIIAGDKEYLSSHSPEELMGELFADEFIRCHQGYWINISKIVRLSNNEITTSGGKTIPIGRAYRQRTKEAFFKFVANKD